MNKAAINLYISFGEYIHSFLLATFLGVELLDHWRGVFFTLVDTVRFPKGLSRLTCPLAMFESSSCCPSSPNGGEVAFLVPVD